MVSEAKALDFLEALDARGSAPTVRHGRRFGLLARQVAGSAAITLRADDGRLCMIVGLWPDAPGHAEAWFAPGPALKANLRMCLHLGRAALEQAAQAWAPVTVAVTIAPDSVAGARLAAWFGFTAGGQTDTPLGPLDSWERRFGHG